MLQFEHIFFYFFLTYQQKTYVDFNALFYKDYK